MNLHLISFPVTLRHYFRVRSKINCSKARYLTRYTNELNKASKQTMKNFTDIYIYIYRMQVHRYEPTLKYSKQLDQNPTLPTRRCMRQRSPSMKNRSQIQKSQTMNNRFSLKVKKKNKKWSNSKELHEFRTHCH